MMDAAIKSNRLKTRKTRNCVWAKLTRRQEAASHCSVENGGRRRTAELVRYWIMAINHPMA